MNTPSLEMIETLTASELLTYIKQWGDDRNITDPANSSVEKQFLKLSAEMGELSEHLAKGMDIKDDIGDMIVVLVMIAGLKGHNIRECLAAAYADIKDRKGLMYKGVFIKESDPRYTELMEKPGHSEGYQALMRAAEASSNKCSINDFHTLMHNHWGEETHRVARHIAGECASFLADTSQRIEGTSHAIADGYRVMYSKALSEGATIDESINTAYYLLSQCFPLDLCKDTALRVIKHGLE